MIRLHKAGLPHILEDHAEVWRDEYLAAVEANEVTEVMRYRYRHPQIKDALKAETHAKCAYCESKITHVHPGETDHIFPVSRRPDLYVEWTNLTFVCSECNRRKSDYYNEAEPLINPYLTDPSVHLVFFGPAVLPRNDMGIRTERQLELSRASLIERKQEMIEQLNLLAGKWQATPDGPTREFLKTDMLERALDPAEFAATARAYLYQALGWRIDAAGIILEDSD